MKYIHTKAKVLNRGLPPDSFLDELVKFGRTAPDDLFAANSVFDVYSSVKSSLGPWQSIKHRRCVMLEVLRVLAGFESSWDWKCGRDVTNSTSVTPDTIEAGAFQVSANSRAFGADLRAMSPKDGNKFQAAMKADKQLAIEYAARLLRHTVRHNGPVLRHEIDPFLSKDAVLEFLAILGG